MQDYKIKISFIYPGFQLWVQIKYINKICLQIAVRNFFKVCHHILKQVVEVVVNYILDKVNVVVDHYNRIVIFPTIIYCASEEWQTIFHSGRNFIEIKQNSYSPSPTVTTIPFSSLIGRIDDQKNFPKIIMWRRQAIFG